jgi:hypothetical protein
MLSHMDKDFVAAIITLVNGLRENMLIINKI